MRRQECGDHSRALPSTRPFFGNGQLIPSLQVIDWNVPAVHMRTKPFHACPGLAARPAPDTVAEYMAALICMTEFSDSISK